jgi:hypothetical protein
MTTPVIPGTQLPITTAINYTLPLADAFLATVYGTYNSETNTITPYNNIAPPSVGEIVWMRIHRTNIQRAEGEIIYKQKKDGTIEETNARASIR